MAKVAPPRTSSPSRREARRAEAQRRARQQQRRTLLTRLGLFGLVGILVGLAAWWFIGRAEEVSGQALYQFNTQDFHSLAFAPTDPNTLFFGHHGGLKVSRDGGKTWDDGSLSGERPGALDAWC